ncbi:hypothetical protein KAT80_00275 [Candidatus Pacearchaeota archaeon]|nr:hypothetical protein [Candidatus Pacearchaeota archaeon]
MKKLILSVLMLGVMMMTVMGVVSANGYYERPCADVDICTWTTSECPDNGLPLGSEDNSNCGLSYNTYWPIDTTATATCVFDGDDLANAMLYISINNDIVSCTLNGQQVFGSTIHENCAPVDPRNGFSQDIYSEVLDGTNTLICEVRDRGVMTHFDACVIGEYEEPCQVIVDEPQASHWYDPVTIQWHYEGDCEILDQEIYYYEGECTGNSESVVELDNNWQREYEWDVSELEDGDYCVCIYGEQVKDGVIGCSGVWHLDLTDPISTISFGYPSVLIGEDYYINTNTPITITCEDEGSGPKTIFYNIYVEDGCGGWIQAHKFSGNVEDDPHKVEFTCHEESRHKIEYWCVDKVGKDEEPNEEIIFVDTTAPIIEKTIVGPQHGDCPPEYEEDICYIDGITEIHVDAYDPKPHPVNDVYCSWWYSVNKEPAGKGDEEILPFVINFPEESYHELWIECWDALGNYVIDYEAFYVDKTPPVIWKDYIGPYYEEESVEWIDGETVIHFGAYEDGEHDSGLAELSYRVTLVDDDYCWNPDICYQAQGSEEWTSVEGSEGSFQIEEQSCHLIEIYAEDNVEKGNLHKQCVFVDKTPPTLYKDVGEPSHYCHGFWESITGKCEDHWDWIVTMDTEIELSCEDKGDHPSGVDKLCWKMEWDDEDVTAQECVSAQGTMEGEWCCISSSKTTVQFYTECEHTLEFKCIDNVEKTAYHELEVFKVEGEAFTIYLEKKWNLISIPFNLISNNIEEVFDQISNEVEVVWTYYDGEWYVYTPNGGPDTLETIEPGYGYWVKMSDYAELVVGGSLLSPGPGIPPSRELQEGWNLIGRYGLGEKDAYCALFSLVDTTIGFPRWSALYSYDAVDDEFIALGTGSDTYPGEGYWINMIQNDLGEVYVYSPATACWGYW